MAGVAKIRRVDKTKKLVRRELVENELLERAAELFGERGFNGTTLKDVADTVGLTRAALYHYFDSKEALLTTLIEGITVARATELKTVRTDASLDAREKLARVTRMMALNVSTHAARFRLLMLSENELPAGLAATQARGRRDVLAQLVKLFEEGIASGEFEPVDPHVAAFAVLGMCNWIAWWFKPTERLPAAAVADQFAGIALAAFARERGAVSDGEDGTAILQRMRSDLARLERFIPET